MVSRISRTISSVVLGWRKAKRATVSPSHVVGVTKPVWSASSWADQAVVVGLAPARAPEEHDRELGRSHQLGVGRLLDHRRPPVWAMARPASTASR